MRRNASQSRPLVRTVRTVRYCLMPGAEPPFAHLSVGECRYVRWWKLLELSIAAMLGLVPGSVSGRYVHLEKAAQSAVERVATRFRRLLDGYAAKAPPSGNVFSIGAPPCWSAVMMLQRSRTVEIRRLLTARQAQFTAVRTMPVKTRSSPDAAMLCDRHPSVTTASRSRGKTGRLLI
jgi:hypothetical protein